MKLDEYEGILKAALVQLHTQQLTIATAYTGAEQEKRLATDFDILVSLHASAMKVATAKLKDSPL